MLTREIGILVFVFILQRPPKCNGKKAAGRSRGLRTKSNSWVGSGSGVFCSGEDQHESVLIG